MRQVWITKHGPPEVLTVREAPTPSPGAGEVLIAVAAAGINFADIMARRGVYPDAPKPPCVVGYEVAGEIEAVGPGVTTLSVGQKAMALTHFGGQSSHVVVPVGQVFPIPPGLDAAHAAALPVTYLTAYQLVVAMGRLAKDETVLIHSAAGGVGLSAIDLATIAGAEIVGVASAAKHDFLRGRGVTKLVDSRAPDLVARVKELTGGRGVDLALDPIGGPSWRRSLDCLAPLGRIGAYGFSAGAEGSGKFLPMLRAAAGAPWLRFLPPALMNANHGVFGVNLGRMWGEAAMLQRWFGDLMHWQAQGRINPVVDRSFPFAEAAAAHAYIEARRNIGKVLLVP